MQILWVRAHPTAVTGPSLEKATLHAPQSPRRWRAHHRRVGSARRRMAPMSSSTWSCSSPSRPRRFRRLRRRPGPLGDQARPGAGVQSPASLPKAVLRKADLGRLAPIRACSRAARGRASAPQTSTLKTAWGRPSAPRQHAGGRLGRRERAPGQIRDGPNGGRASAPQSPGRSPAFEFGRLGPGERAPGPMIHADWGRPSAPRPRAAFRTGRVCTCGKLSCFGSTGAGRARPRPDATCGLEPASAPQASLQKAE